ncbi:uncharacterized protein LOC110440260 isoform X2 [Mizuhopecten yessoensis]|uniref:uncharacterized protein LOC110440260 isoform X2 n=1 Tax=Mizuhopecten yessoensis TaxID=6573 RepID=UPI000B4587A8|nr:uncharacterized protein LOC110440260 isoform X2 [Mizuhopecten yessoensis]
MSERMSSLFITSDMSPSTSLSRTSDRISSSFITSTVSPSTPLNTMSDRMSSSNINSAVSPSPPLSTMSDRISTSFITSNLSPSTPLSTMSDRMSSSFITSDVSPSTPMSTMSERMSSAYNKSDLSPSTPLRTMSERMSSSYNKSDVSPSTPLRTMSDRISSACITSDLSPSTPLRTMSERMSSSYNKSDVLPSTPLRTMSERMSSSYSKSDVSPSTPLRTMLERMSSSYSKSDVLPSTSLSTMSDIISSSFTKSDESPSSSQSTMSDRMSSSFVKSDVSPSTPLRTMSDRISSSFITSDVSLSTPLRKMSERMSSSYSKSDVLPSTSLSTMSDIISSSFIKSDVSLSTPMSTMTERIVSSFIKSDVLPKSERLSSSFLQSAVIRSTSLSEMSESMSSILTETAASSSMHPTSMSVRMSSSVTQLSMTQPPAQSNVSKRNSSFLDQSSVIKSKSISTMSESMSSSNIQSAVTSWKSLNEMSKRVIPSSPLSSMSNVMFLSFISSAVSPYSSLNTIGERMPSSFIDPAVSPSTPQSTMSEKMTSFINSPVSPSTSKNLMSFDVKSTKHELAPGEHSTLFPSETTFSGELIYSTESTPQLSETTRTIAVSSFASLVSSRSDILTHSELASDMTLPTNRLMNTLPAETVSIIQKSLLQTTQSTVQSQPDPYEQISVKTVTTSILPLMSSATVVPSTALMTASVTQTSGLPVTLVVSSSTVTPLPKDEDIMLQIRIQVKQKINVTTDAFRDDLTVGLAETYAEASSERRKRDIHLITRRKRQDNIQVQITNITRNDVEDGVDVAFYILEDGSAVPAQTAKEKYNRLSEVETSAILGYPVLEPVSLALKTPETDQPDTGGLSGPLTILLIVVPSAIVVVLTLSYFIMHYGDQPRTGTLASVKSGHSGSGQKSESLADHDLVIDMEKGDIVSRSSVDSGRSTARKTSAWLRTMWNDYDPDVTDVKQPCDEVIDDNWDTLSMTLKSRSWSLKSYPFIDNDIKTKRTNSKGKMHIFELPDTNLDEVSQKSNPDLQRFDIIGKTKNHIKGLQETDLGQKTFDIANLRSTEDTKVMQQDQADRKKARTRQEPNGNVRTPLVDIPVTSIRDREPYVGKRQKRQFKTNSRRNWKRRKAFKHTYEGFTNKFRPDPLATSTLQNSSVTDYGTTPSGDRFEIASTYFGPSIPYQNGTSGVSNFEGFSTNIISDPISTNLSSVEARVIPCSTFVGDNASVQFEAPCTYYGSNIPNGIGTSAVRGEQNGEQDTLPLRAVRFGSIDVIPEPESLAFIKGSSEEHDNQTNMHVTEFATFPNSTILENDERKEVPGYPNFDVMVPHTNLDTEQLLMTDEYRKAEYGFSNEIFQHYEQTPIVRLQERESQDQYYFAFDESQAQDLPLTITDDAVYIAEHNNRQRDKRANPQHTEPLYANHSHDRLYKDAETGRMWGGGFNNSQLLNLGDMSKHSTPIQPTYVHLSGVSNNSCTEDVDLSLDIGGRTGRVQDRAERSNKNNQNYDDNFPKGETTNIQQYGVDIHPADHTGIQYYNTGQPTWPSRQSVEFIGLEDDYQIAETRFPSFEPGYTPNSQGTNPTIVISHVPHQRDDPYVMFQDDESTHNLRIEGVEENESSTEADPVIGQQQLTSGQHQSESGHYSQQVTNPQVPKPNTKGHPQSHPNMEVSAGQFENVAKMSRLALSSGGSASEKAAPPVKVRPVYYTPGSESPAFRHVHSESDSRSDASTPRPPRPRGDRPMSGRDGQRVFYRAPFTGEPGKMEEYSIEDRAGLEKWRNKQRQREFKQRLSKEELEDERKENRRRRILTRRQRDQLHRGHNDDLYEAYSDVDARYGNRNYASSRSGYSTPGGSCDERNLGRSMRAAPRHVRPAKGGSRPSSASKDKDLIEMLNRQQHMMLQQREQRHRFLEDQKIKQHAQQVVNRALLQDSFDERKINSKDTKEMKQLLNDAFPLAGNAHEHLLSSNGIVDDTRKSVEGDVTPTNYAYQSQTNKSGSNTPISALDQLMTEGRVSHQSSRKNSSQADNGDFFDTGRKDLPEEKNDEAEKTESSDEKLRQEGEGKYMQAIRDELQRLNTS